MATKEASAKKTSRAGKKKTPGKRGGQRKTTRTPGWGGPARGSGGGVAPYKFKQAGPGRGHYTLEGEGRLERQARHAEEMRGLYYEFANNELLPVETRLKAATHLLDRTEGLPVQKIVTGDTDPLTLLPDNELVNEIERQRAIVAEFEAAREADQAKTE